MIKLYINPTALFGMLLVAASPGTPAEDVKIIGNGIYPSGHETTVSPGPLENIMKSEIGTKVAKAALSVLLPQMAQGIPIDITQTDSNLYIYLNTKMAVTLLQAVITPLLSDNETVKAIIEYFENSPELKPLVPQIDKALELIPEALERTNDFKLGLSLEPYKQ